MNVKKINKIICLALFGAVAVNAQVYQPHSLYFMQTVPQVSQINPAIQPRANGFVALPVNVNVALLSDFAVKDVFQKQGNKWCTFYEKQYDYEKLWKSIGKNNSMINLGVDIDILGFGFRTGNSYLSFGLSEHVMVYNALPSDLFKIIESGFPDKSTFNLSSLRTQTIAYQQLRFGYSIKAGDRLTIGVNVKPLSGLMAAVSQIQKVKLQTSQQMWNIDVNSDFYSSAPIDLILNEDGNISKTEKRELGTKDWWQNYAYSFQNPGIAFDFGAAYQINEQVMVSVSLNNLGFISWKKDLNRITSYGNFQFKGIEYDITKDNNLWKSLKDTLKNVVQYDVQHNKFNTALTPVLHLGASYNLSRSVSLGLLSRSALWENNIRQSFNLSFCLQPYSFVAFNVNATWQVKSDLTLGGGFSFLIGPLQIYLLTDCVPVYYSILRIYKGEKQIAKIPVPEHLKSLTSRIGINLIFGRHGNVNQPMLDKGTCSWK